MLASLVSTPFVIRFLGAEAYGVLIVVGLIPMYLSFADFGMGIASTKFASEAYGQGLREREGEVIRTAALLAVVSSFLVCIPMFVFSGGIVSRLSVPLHLQGEGSLALRLTTVSFVLGLLASIFNSAQLARLRMDLNSSINAAGRLFLAIMAPVVLYLGYGIVGAAAVGTVAATVTLVAHVVVSGSLLKELYDSSIESKLIKPLLKFGGGMLASTMALSLLGNIEKFFLSALVSVKSLAYYSVAFTFATMSTLLTAAMMQSLIPAFSQLSVPEKKHEFQALYSRGTRFNIIWLLPVLMVLTVAAEPFFTVWAGPEFGENSPLPFYVLLCGLLFNIVAYVPYAAIVASGRSDLIAKLYWVELGLYAVFSYVLIVRFGIVGAALAWSVRVIFDAAALIYFATKILNVSFEYREYLTGLTVAFAILSVPVIFVFHISTFNVMSWVVSLTCLLFYIALVWLKLLHQDEKKWVMRMIFSKLGRKA